MVHTLLAAAALAAIPTSGQDEILLVEGGPVPGAPGASVGFLSSYRLDGRGVWSARIFVSSLGGGLAVTSDGRSIVDGTALSVGTVNSTTSPIVSPLGVLATQSSVRVALPNDNEWILFWDGSPVAREGTPVVDGSGTPVGALAELGPNVFDLDGDERIIFVGPLAGADEDERSLFEIDLTPAEAGAPRLLLGPSAPYPDGTEVIDVVSVSVNDAGQLLTVAEERLGGFSAVGVRVDGQLVARTGSPAPVPGHLWDLDEAASFGAATSFHLDDTGAVTITGRLIGPFGTSVAVARDQQLVAWTGPDVGLPARSVAAIARGATSTPRGHVLWFGAESSGGPVVLFEDQDVLLAPGDGFAGETIDVVRAGGATENGGFLAVLVDLADGRTAVLRRALPVEVQGCQPAGPNSVGLLPQLHALGSDFADGAPLHLSASGLPPLQGCILAVGSAAGLSAIPGSQGTLCLTGAVGRFPTVLNSGAAGRVEFELDAAS
ncbi:MAG: hypothetical protein AAFP86_04395, partial [Planctomycetota bacterium]